MLDRLGYQGLQDDALGEDNVKIEAVNDVDMEVNDNNDLKVENNADLDVEDAVKNNVLEKGIK